MMFPRIQIENVCVCVHRYEFDCVIDPWSRIWVVCCKDFLFVFSRLSLALTLIRLADGQIEWTTASCTSEWAPITHRLIFVHIPTNYICIHRSLTQQTIRWHISEVCFEIAKIKWVLGGASKYFAPFIVVFIN